MTDKYEEFKEWFKNQTDITWRATDCFFVDYDDELPFRKFEHEQMEKEREKQVKETIKNSIDKFALEKCGIGWINVDIIYNDLKEKDLLK